MRDKVQLYSMSGMYKADWTYCNCSLQILGSTWQRSKVYAYPQQFCNYCAMVYILYWNYSMNLSLHILVLTQLWMAHKEKKPSKSFQSVKNSSSHTNQLFCAILKRINLLTLSIKNCLSCYNTWVCHQNEEIKKAPGQGGQQNDLTGVPSTPKPQTFKHFQTFVAA